ncbi:ribosomal RNA small subunit methyltransferase RsmB [Azospira oryzae PS]|uniref:16S rRNA (cytosine(967)-C(5))-methyltransferase n=1 Tax=Azospira oryzae (strain ATCC BAA-33 / DSM 13638 / PS) TaxID=640081 RepID=G8QHR8_AZOOP|nr:16S rRNA (cytosine(967)-C(5))-methyltransferase RsmB [Azospira oryzae]AEV25219.1 ribosomal RNA small subunit methyltransferase RsmB [Azospira oryzae PS]
MSSRNSPPAARRPSPVRSAPEPAPDSLARALLLASAAVAAVQAGRSLTEVLAQQAKGELGPTRAQAQDLAYGALRRYGWGEAVLAALLQKPLPEPQLQSLLLCALYRLESRPEQSHTVVDQAVAAAATLAKGNFRGVINGVLRSYLRQRPELLARAAGKPSGAWWHPDWWLSRLRRAYPRDWEAIATAGNGQPPMTLRVNLARGSREEYQARLDAAGIAAVPLGSAALLLQKPVPVDALPGFFDGFVSVQDWGAQRAAELLDARAGQRVLDACAAPGGKTAHILEQAGVDLLALDMDGLRCRRVEENLSRLGLRAVVRAADARCPDDWWDGRPFDRILADVPCSASGVVRRHPDSKWLRRETDIAQFARVQRQILEVLWPTLAVGGRLLYATCSVFPEENSQQVSAFLARHGDARRIGIDGADELQLLPGSEHDGFYYALLEKTA